MKKEYERNGFVVLKREGRVDFYRESVRVKRVIIILICDHKLFTPFKELKR